jgi:hypothetical protein
LAFTARKLNFLNLNWRSPLKLKNLPRTSLGPRSVPFESKMKSSPFYGSVLFFSLKEIPAVSLENCGNDFLRNR